MVCCTTSELAARPNRGDCDTKDPIGTVTCHGTAQELRLVGRCRCSGGRWMRGRRWHLTSSDRDLRSVPNAARDYTPAGDGQRNGTSDISL
jgi:hypothetical protein